MQRYHSHRICDLSCCLYGESKSGDPPSQAEDACSMLIGPPWEHTSCIKRALPMAIACPATVAVTPLPAKQIHSTACSPVYEQNPFDACQ